MKKLFIICFLCLIFHNVAVAVVTVSEEDSLLFEQNGYSYDDVNSTVQHYREIGLSDDEIQRKIDTRIKELKNARETKMNYALWNQFEIVEEIGNNKQALENNTNELSYEDTVNFAQSKLNAITENLCQKVYIPANILYVIAAGIAIQLLIKGKAEKMKNLLDINKKNIIIAIILAICLYQLFFRYEYKVYKGNGRYSSYVIKIDKLTGKSTCTQPVVYIESD